MDIGKVPNNVLNKIVLGKINNKRSEILVRPSIGEDCCSVDFGEYECVISGDPITGAAKDIGRLAVLVACNDIASCGVEPLGLLITLLAPPGTTENELERVMEQLSKTADSINVDIIGGHTEITDSVNRIIINATAIGRGLKGQIVTSKGAKHNDKLILTKSAGLEGTAILASEKENSLLPVLGKEILDEGKSFFNRISVVKEGLISAEFGVSAMHDVTEGGLLGAVWELCEASQTGAKIYKEMIPIAKSTNAICEYFNIDPLKLISSGCLLIAAKDGDGLVKRLRSSGIEASVIGSIMEGNERIIFSGDEAVVIQQPVSDELYNCFLKS